MFNICFSTKFSRRYELSESMPKYFMPKIRKFFQGKPIITCQKNDILSDFVNFI